MSMQPSTRQEIPKKRDASAKAAFPKGNVYMRMRDELGELYCDEQFAELFPAGAAGSVAGATGVGDGDAVCRRLDGSASGRCRTRADGSEICARTGVDRCGV